MSDTQATFARAIQSLVDKYHRIDAAAGAEARPGDAAPLFQELASALEPVTRELVANPVALEGAGNAAIDACFELCVIALLVADEPQQQSLVETIEEVLRSVLSIDTTQTRRAGAKLVGCLLLALDELPAVADRVLALLGSLTGRNEGLRQGTPTQPSISISPDVALDLSKLLDYALFGEVFAFLAGLPSLRDATAQAGLADVSVPLASIASRKGGVGKSTLALALALEAVRRKPGRRVCILDLDITGPTWQYLLCADGRTRNGEPIRYLNHLLQLDQPDTAFDFGQPEPEAVLACVADAFLPGVQAPIGLLTFADLPRTNRYLVQAIANNRSSFTSFLVALLRGVSSSFDFVIIDNTPGFDPHPLITLVLAGRVQFGLPLVVSTDQAPDLRGCFLELSDLRLLHFNRPPVWIVNKAGEEAEKFFSQELTLPQIAGLTRSYAEIMPDAPLLQRFLTPRPPSRTVRALPFDLVMALPNSDGIDLGSPLTSSAVERFLGSALYRRFESEIAPHLIRHLFPEAAE
jgi:hypothetical protein